MEYLGENKPVNQIQPLLSVCIQTYQHKKYIRDCLDGVLMQQTDFPFDVIIGEDESTDGTREICMEYANKYPDKIRLFLRSRKDVIYINGQPTGRFNYYENLKAARGKYIAVCEGDDYWTDPFKLQKQVDYLEANEECSACFHETQELFEKDKSLGKIYGASAPDRLFAVETIATLSPFHTSSFLFRRTALRIPDFFFQVVSADMALFSIISEKGYIKKIPGIMSVYRKHDTGLTNTEAVINSFHEKRIELISLLDEYHNHAYSEKAKQVIDYHRSLIKKKVNLMTNNDFVNIKLTHNNMDVYYVKASILKALKTALSEFKGTLIDIGCGKMPYKEYIFANSEVCRYVGLDIENTLVYDKNVKPDFTWDGIKMPFNTNEFDCAMATEVLEHCPEPETVLKETYRVLKPGGVFFFTVPFLWNLHEVPHDEYRYTPFSLERHFRNAGFSDVEIKATGGWHAAMAQMLGLWLKRSPILQRKRKMLSAVLLPVMRKLIKMDELHDVKFKEGQMISGLYGMARKD